MSGPCRWVLRHPKTVVALAVLIMATTVPVYLKLGTSSCRRSTKA